MTNEEAWLFAASWGSYMNASDPGACLYGFNESFRVQSEKHRADCLEHMVDNRAWVEAHPNDYDEDELANIDAFVECLKAAEVAA